MLSPTQKINAFLWSEHPQHHDGLRLLLRELETRDLEKMLAIAMSLSEHCKDELELRGDPHKPVLYEG